MSENSPAIVTFTSAGRALAKKLTHVLGGEIFQCGSGKTDASTLLPLLFEQNTPIIGICATGILVRLLAPHLRDKHLEPPVISISQDGQHVVPILGGHRGANVLAGSIAKVTGGTVAITTASEAKFKFALDDPPSGYVLADHKPAKTAMVAVLNGASLNVSGEDDWLTKAGYNIAPTGTVSVTVSEKIPANDTLTYHPKTLIAGIGCARNAPTQEVIDLLQRALSSAGLTQKSLAAIATIDIKSDELALLEAADHFGVPLRLFSADELASERHNVPNPSQIVERETGTPSVAEAAAIKAGSLVLEKIKTANATCAIGSAEHPLDITKLGRAPGQLHLVGIGPGEIIQRTLSATKALVSADDWVGYGLYLDLVADLNEGQNQHSFALGEEEKRTRYALELAATGKNVALICSGDAQIFAMAALTYELLDETGTRAVSAAAKRVAVESHPGISALQMASARAGALLGHDFCAISLSDLMTPRDIILQRLHAAAQGDFVTAFYNPRSKRRIDLIKEAKEIFLRHRPPETPVIIASNLGREGEKVRTIELQDFVPEEIDMLTIVLFGASQSKAFKRGNGQTIAFTPRGYANKASDK